MFVKLNEPCMGNQKKKNLHEEEGNIKKLVKVLEKQGKGRGRILKCVFVFLW